MEKLIAASCRVMGWAMAACLAVMVVLVFGNVVLRYVFNSGITVSEELSRWLFVWMTFLGAIVALQEGAHLGTDMLVSRLSVRGRKVCLVLGHLLMLFVCVLLFRGSLAQMKVNLATTSAVMQISMALFYATGLLCAVAGGVILLNQLWRLATGQLADGELVGIRESEDEPVDLARPLR